MPNEETMNVARATWFVCSVSMLVRVSIVVITLLLLYSTNSMHDALKDFFSCLSTFVFAFTSILSAVRFDARHTLMQHHSQGGDQATWTQPGFTPDWCECSCRYDPKERHKRKINNKPRKPQTKREAEGAAREIGP